MKYLSHPDLEINKEKVLNKMPERIDLVVDKMTNDLKVLHQALTDDLNLETEINNKVLTSKMG